jgi:hypothetical protein
MSDIEQRAKAFAIRAHDAIGQKRKYTGAPYWTHCGEVADNAAPPWTSGLSIRCHSRQ